MAGVDRNTGALLAGWPHVVQSISVIFTTGRGERVMRRYFGSNVPRLLGENLVPDTIIRFYAAIASALDLWEPRFKVMRMIPQTVSPEQLRMGHYAFTIEGEYRPRGHLGDIRAESIKQVTVSGLFSSSGGAISVIPA